MGYKADEEQVVAMSHRYTNKTIADRLNISTRTVTRILAKRGRKNLAGKKDPPPDIEQQIIEFERKRLNYSLSRIAFLHGLSRQAIHQRIKNNEINHYE